MLNLKLVNGDVKNFDQEKISVLEVAHKIAISLGKNAIAAIVDGQLQPLDYLITTNATIEIITNTSAIAPSILNYSAGLAIAAALHQNFPKISLAKISANDEFFYVDFKTNDSNLKESEIVKIEQIAKELIKTTKPIRLITKSLNELNSDFKNNEFVLDILQKNSKNQQKESVYFVGEFEIYNSFIAIDDLKKAQHFNLTTVSGVYWDDDADNEMIQRLTGYARWNLNQLVEFNQELENRRNSDHRKIGKELEIFMFDNLIGQGLPIWLPNGTILKNEIKKYLQQKEWEYDFIQIETPVVGTVDLYKTSGHWDHYRKDMFDTMDVGNEQLVLKPMSCPHHIAIYKNKIRTFKNLPLRFAEHALQHRYEASGALTGLERVRAMELTDSHIFVRPDQIAMEFKRCYQLIEEVLNAFHIEIDYFSLSLRDPLDKEKYFQNDEMWDLAENQLEQTLIDLKIRYKKMVGEAAFYGPKLDIQAKTALGHEITVSTIQLDFLLPTKFQITYVDSNNENQTPVMIHRGLIGTYERFIAILLEQTKGVLPFWLAPRQVTIIPISNEFNDYAMELQTIFKQNLIRSEIDNRDERLSYKIRDAQVNKVCFQIVIGTDEVKNKTVTYRQYGSEEQLSLSINAFKEMLLNLRATKQ